MTLTPMLIFFIRTLFACSSFLGQAASLGKIYLSHVFAIPFLMSRAWIYFKRPSRSLRPSFLLFTVFFCWVSITYALNRDGDSFKFLIIYSLGLLQLWCFLETNEQERIRILKYLSILAAVDIFIGLLETLELWRFPLSGLNPDAFRYGRNPILDFSNLPQDSISYLKSVPTGLRWGANNFILGCLIYLLFIARFGKKWSYYLILGVSSFLTVYASSRLLLWIGFPVIAIFAFFRFNLRDAILSLSLPFSITFLLTFSSAPLNYKADECLYMPWKIAATYLADAPTSKLITADQGKGKVLKSEIHRKDFFKITMSNFISAPILGNGPGKGSVDRTTNKKISPHFYFLEILADFGVIGGILFFCAFLYPLYAGIKSKSRNLPFTASLLSLLAIGSITLSSLAYYPLFYLSLSFLNSETED